MADVSNLAVFVRLKMIEATMFRVLVTAVFFLVAASNVNAGLVGIEFDDPVGPHWTGVVDTTSNQLTIHTWTENAGGTVYWTPTLASLPLVWPAVDGAGAPYDVPDTFATSLIDATFAFISPTTLGSMSWNEGSQPVFTTEYPGWGGDVSDGNLYVGGDATWMCPLLSSPSGASCVTGNVTVTAVPEPSAFVFLGLVGLGVVGWKKLGAKRKMA